MVALVCEISSNGEIHYVKSNEKRERGSVLTLHRVVLGGSRRVEREGCAGVVASLHFVIRIVGCVPATALH